MATKKNELKGKKRSKICESVLVATNKIMVLRLFKFPDMLLHTRKHLLLLFSFVNSKPINVVLRSECLRPCFKFNTK